MIFIQIFPTKDATKGNCLPSIEESTAIQVYYVVYITVIRTYWLVKYSKTCNIYKSSTVIYKYRGLLEN